MDASCGVADLNLGEGGGSLRVVLDVVDDAFDLSDELLCLWPDLLFSLCLKIMMFLLHVFN